MMGWMLLLGAYHGINPAMGWLFAVALGMQQGSARGVWRALPPIALGHLLSVGAVVLTAGVAQLLVPLGVLKVVVASILVGFGVYRLRRHRHPRYGGMRVGFRDLTIWSFLMATAHGAGFMVLPFIGMFNRVEAAEPALMSSHAHHTADANWTAAMLLGVHTLSYFAVMVLSAWIVYRWIGLALLRKAWFNLDLLWAGALVVTGAVILLR
jgi:uncharacterized membrane protein